MADATGKPAVVLLSGGLDSTTTLAVARDAGFTCHALTFDYGQRHAFELAAARRVAAALGAVEHRIVTLDLSAEAGFGHSALTGDLAVPKADAPPPGPEAGAAGGDIPVTYVPGRNMIFLSVSVAHAECVGAFDVFVGVNAVDYSGYPDCRPAFIEAFERAANLGAAAGVQGEGRFTIHAPLIDMTKGQIIRTGLALGVDYALTHTCYDPGDDGTACGRCDACRLRRAGFREADAEDPLTYMTPARPPAT